MRFPSRCAEDNEQRESDRTPVVRRSDQVVTDIFLRERSALDGPAPQPRSHPAGVQPAGHLEHILSLLCGGNSEGIESLAKQSSGR